MGLLSQGRNNCRQARCYCVMMHQDGSAGRGIAGTRFVGKNNDNERIVGARAVPKMAGSALEVRDDHFLLPPNGKRVPEALLAGHGDGGRHVDDTRDWNSNRLTEG